MARRTAKFACAILAGLVGSALLTLLPLIPAAVADDCLTVPTGDKADGQHWRYRLERGRRCWYLKDSTAATQNTAEDTKPRQANQAPSAWDFAQPTPPKFTTRRGNGPAPRASTDALADDDTRVSAKPQAGASPSLVRTQPATSFDESLQRNAAAPSWQPLDSADMDSTASAPPTASASPVPDELALPPESAASAPSPDSPAAAPAKPAKPLAPIRKLLMVVVGALSLSGLLASALYRLSKVGRRHRRNRNWQRAIARVRRNRDKPRAKSKVVHAGGRSGRVAKQRPVVAPAPAAKRAAPPPVVAIEPNPAAVRATPSAPAPLVAVEPKSVVATAAAVADPAAELVDLLASHAANAPPPQTAATPSRPAEPAPEVTPPAPAKVSDPAAELVDLLGSHAAKRAVQPPVAEAATPALPPQSTPPRLPLVADPAAELANLLESRFAPPPAPPARPVAARAKPRPPVVPVNNVAPKAVDPISELANLLEAKENERAARFGGADGRHRSGPPPVAPPVPPPAKPVDPAAELFDMLEARATRTPVSPAPAPQPVKAVQPRRLEPSMPEPVTTAPPVRPSQPSKAMTPRRKKVAPPVRIDMTPASRVQAPAEPIRHAVTPPQAAAARPDHPRVDRPKAASPKAAAPKIATPKLATPKPGKGARHPADGAPRRKDTELPPLPPALMLEPENNGPEPPLDFIPRPQALRPRMRDIRQDESLDGVQDILARLAKHG